MRGVLPIAIAMVAACGSGAGGGDDAGDDDGAPIDVPDPSIDRFEPQICDTTCPPPHPATCPFPNGDPQQPIELVPVTWDQQTNQLVDILDGDHLKLLRPFQGGRVIYVGVRARNLVDGCNVYVNGAIRDTTDNRIMGLEQRPTVLETTDTWAVPVQPYIQSLANVPLCPNFAADRDLYGNTWQLELRLEEGARRTTVIRSITLDCVEDGSGFARCDCECDSDYTGGGTCPGGIVDAGTD